MRDRIGLTRAPEPKLDQIRIVKPRCNPQTRRLGKLRKALTVIVGIEVGGTFTDLVMVDEQGGLTVHKIPSTPTDPSIAAVSGMGEILDMSGQGAADVDELLHGSTIAANALIQRRGARTALITTLGFRDVLFIQRQDKSSVYDMFYQIGRAHV